MANEFKPAIEWRDIDSVIPYVSNAKHHPDEQIDKIAGSIAEFGWDQPIVVDGDGIIIKGHGRKKAAIKLGLKKVPIVVRTDLTPAQVKAARIADNKIAETGWDTPLLSADLKELQELDFDLNLLGFDMKELSNLLGAFSSDDKSSKESIYTDKIESPVYSPTGEKPKISDLFNQEKSISLIQEIEKSNLPEEKKNFLKLAAYRHIVFNYQNIAEFYAHESKDVQELMEKSALVIIDFGKAIENGFVKMTKSISEVYPDSEGVDEE